MDLNTTDPKEEQPGRAPQPRIPFGLKSQLLAVQAEWGSFKGGCGTPPLMPSRSHISPIPANARAEGRMELGKGSCSLQEDESSSFPSGPTQEAAEVLLFEVIEN